MRTITLNNQTYPVEIAPPEPLGNSDLKQFNNMLRKYNWTEFIDENHNTVWILQSPYEEGFTFRLKQRLFNDEIEWYEAHDAQLLNGKPDWWLDIGEAKAAIEQCWENIWTDNSDWSQKQFKESVE